MRNINPRTVPELLMQLRELGVPPEEYAGRVRSFLEFKARDRGVPYSGKFELTPLCNLDCKMCYIHLQKEQMGDTWLMEPAVWKHLMSQAAEMGMMEALLTGGECLTYPWFEELYLHLHSMGVETAIYTNGVGLTAQRITFLRAHPPMDMQISLYGSNEDAYEAVTGYRQFARVLENIQAAKAAGLPVRIAITPSVFMDGDVENIIRLAHGLELPYSINWSLFDPRENTGRHGQSMDLPVDDYVRFYKLRMELEGNAVQPVPPESLPDVAASESSVGRGLRCGGGRSSFSIGYDGKMYICGMLQDTVAYPLETGFSEAWRIINQAAEEYPVPCQCVGCSYRGECPTCVVHHAAGAPPGEVNPAICQRTRRMAAEGLIQIDIGY